ncbi:hypothetical protein ACQ4PT_059847 [Festuca glaucescens]
MGQEERQDRELPVMDKELPSEAHVACDYCSEARAAVYCRADSARLCLPCDRLVHAANAVCSRHARAPLCAACLSTGAVFRHGHGHGAGAGFLCSNCDFGRNQDGGMSPLNSDRCTVQSYTGRPTAHELAAVLGVPDFEKPKAARADEGWWDIWDEPQVFSVEDLIVPTTSVHGFQPLVTPSSPKNPSSQDGKANEEVIKQLRELAEADGGGGQIAPHEEAQQAAHQLPSWTPSQYIAENGNFGTDNSYEVATMPTPGYENGGWNNGNYHALNDACKTEYEHEQAPISSAEACLSSFVQMSELCPSMSNGSMMDDSHQAKS